MTESLNRALEFARDLMEDLDFGYVHDWKQKKESRRVIGHLPVYVPREIIHASGMLPVGIFGGGDRFRVVKGDAFFQSYICHLPRSVIELALDGHYSDFDGFVFPAICDVIRNLSGIFRIQFPDTFITYLDFPQNFAWEVGGEFYFHELRRFQSQLYRLNGVEVTRDDLNRSISYYNKNRQLVTQLGETRSLEPWKISTSDFYSVVRAGYLLPVEDHNQYLEEVLGLLEGVEREPQDNIRVIISGAFCEQPPMGLIKTIENAGCYIIEDDFHLGSSWILEDIDDQSDDPVEAISRAYLQKSTSASSRFDGNGSRGKQLAKLAREQKADGVVFCAPSFCDPALLDRPSLEKALDHHHIRHVSFQYHENLGQFKVIKEQVGTFSDSIKLWE